MVFTRRATMTAMFAGGLTVLACSAVQAQPSPAVRHACMPDVQKLCSGVSSGGGRIKACLEAHANDLSSDCRDALAAQHDPGR